MPDHVVLIIALVCCKCIEHFVGCIVSGLSFHQLDYTPIHTQIPPIFPPSLPPAPSLSLSLSPSLLSLSVCEVTYPLYVCCAAAAQPCGGLGIPLSTSAGLVDCSATGQCPTMHFCHNTDTFAVCCPGL